MYAKKKDAISLGSLSAAQAGTLPFGSLAATISDNTSGTLSASYTTSAFKLSGGLERIRFENPSLPVAAGFAGLGGYFIGVTNNAAFPYAKTLDVSWVGLKYLIASNLDLTGAYYHYDQNAYGHDEVFELVGCDLQRRRKRVLGSLGLSPDQASGCLCGGRLLKG